MSIKHLNIILVILPLLFCSCEKEKKQGYDPESPEWTAQQFFLALSDGAFYEAGQFCDKSSRKDLENDYFYREIVPQINFIKVDSCDEFEDHAYCYCRYLSEDSTEHTNKLLLRNFNDFWKVHYENFQADSNNHQLYRRIPVINESAPKYLSKLEEKEINDLDSVISSTIRIMNHVDAVVGFLTESNLANVAENATKEYSYNNFYIQRLVLERINVTQTFTFDSQEELELFEVVIMDIDSDNKFGEFQYLIEQLIIEYGTPYNAKEILLKKMYKYKEIKWFLKGFNEELILSCEYKNITLTLRKAH